MEIPADFGLGNPENQIRPGATSDCTAGHIGENYVDERRRFNPDLFQFDPAASYPWQVFPRTTVATITWNRLPYTRRLISSLQRYSQMPYDLLVVDNASHDGTLDYLAELEATTPGVRVVRNSKNVGVARGWLQIRDLVPDGLLVLMDNDIEILSNYWLIHVHKAFHAVRLARGRPDAALGFRLINWEEYGFLFAEQWESLPIPARDNAYPRTSYAARSKDDPDTAQRLDEVVSIGWTSFLNGGLQAWPTALYRRMPLEEMYPTFIAGADSFTSNAANRAGVPMGYVGNGPVARHNDWPYSEDKVRLYAQRAHERAVTDRAYWRWKLKHTWRRLLGKT